MGLVLDLVATTTMVILKCLEYMYSPMRLKGVHLKALQVKAIMALMEALHMLDRSSPSLILLAVTSHAVEPMYIQRRPLDRSK